MKKRRKCFVRGDMKGFKQIFILLLLFCILSAPATGDRRAYAECAAADSSGSVTLQVAQDWLADYINRLRTEPGEALAELGINGTISLPPHEETVCNSYGCFTQVFDTFPLARSQFLDTVAMDRAQDMAERNYFSYSSPEGTTINDMLEKAGYPSSNGTQIISAILIREFQDPCQAVTALIRNLLEKGLSDTEVSDNVAALLNNRYDAIGLALTPAVFQMPDGSSAGAYYLVIILDRPFDMFRSRLVQCGHLYRDINGDGIYQAGEGLDGRLFYNDKSDILAATYRDGMFCLERSAEPDWTWHVDDRYLGSNEMRGISFWIDGEFRQDINLKSMFASDNS